MAVDLAEIAMLGGVELVAPFALVTFVTTLRLLSCPSEEGGSRRTRVKNVTLLINENALLDFSGGDFRLGIGQDRLKRREGRRYGVDEGDSSKMIIERMAEGIDGSDGA
jgi:hypothetical protein